MFSGKDPLKKLLSKRLQPQNISLFQDKRKQILFTILKYEIWILTPPPET